MRYGGSFIAIHAIILLNETITGAGFDKRNIQLGADPTKIYNEGLLIDARQEEEKKMQKEEMFSLEGGQMYLSWLIAVHLFMGKDLNSIY